MNESERIFFQPQTMRTIPVAAPGWYPPPADRSPVCARVPIAVSVSGYRCPGSTTRLPFPMTHGCKSIHPSKYRRIDTGIPRLERALLELFPLRQTSARGARLPHRLGHWQGYESLRMRNLRCGKGEVNQRFTNRRLSGHSVG